MSRHRHTTLVVALTTAVAALVAAPSGAVSTSRQAGVAHAASTSPTRVLLALGDSLAAGYQPTDGNVAPAPNPTSGFADGGYPHGYAADLATHDGLRLLDLACPGETTASMRAIAAQRACTRLYQGEFGVASQEAAAMQYLARNPKSVALVTIDIGANDLSGCATRSSQVNLTCVASAEKRVVTNLPALLQPLERATHEYDPGARIAAMTYYDPFLGLVVDPGGTTATESAAVSLIGINSFDAQLSLIYRRAGILVADVAGAFKTNSALPLTRVGTQIVPENVARICQLTWMCPPHSGTQSPDIHPNAAGYALVASTFETRLA